ncbi:MAG: asparagine synthase-related protein [Actinomycetota bacterium]|nr:asparagine synthase-related protein [Actinomycetota bacterium]
MNRAIAGAFDPTATEALRQKVIGALEPDGPAQAFQDGPLAVAWTGGGDEARDGDAAPSCLLDGHLTNLGAMTERAGLPPGLAPERVLLGLYARFGEGMFESLRGSWVVLVWDPANRRLLVARDQVNARPLFARIVGDRVLFASEVRNLLRLVDRRPDPDRGAVGHWLAHSRLPSDRTLYEGLARVPAGHLLRVVDGRVALRRYWTPVLGPRLEGSREELGEQLRAEIVGAVERRCEPGATAVMLSGGLDSTTLAAVSARCVAPERAPVHTTYSMTFPSHPGSDETEQIDATVAELGLASTRIEVESSGILFGSLEYLHTWQLPATATTLSYWLPLARRAAEDGIRVVLDGEDGDDLFGCSPWLAADLLSQGRPLAMLKMLRRMPLLAEAPAQVWLGTAYRIGVKGSMPHFVHRAMRSLRGPDVVAPTWLDERTGRAYAAATAPWGWKQPGQPRWWTGRVELLFTGGFPASLFDHARRRAALAGIERRHPFADLDLISFVDRLPPELAFDPRFNRPFLRDSMAGIVPDHVRLQAPKMDINSFVDAGIAADLPVMAPFVRARDARLQAYVRPEALRELFEPGTELSTLGQQLGFRAWRCMEMEGWLRSQEEPTFAADMLQRPDLVRPRYELRHVPARGS